MLFGDAQIGMIAKDYYQDKSFCRRGDGSICLWNVYNLFTGANKQSYVDTFLDRGVNAFETGKTPDSIAFTGLRIRFGAGFTMQFQNLKHENNDAITNQAANKI